MPAQQSRAHGRGPFRRLKAEAISQSRQATRPVVIEHRTYQAQPCFGPCRRVIAPAMGSEQVLEILVHTRAPLVDLLRLAALGVRHQRQTKIDVPVTRNLAVAGFIEPLLRILTYGLEHAVACFLSLALASNKRFIGYARQ